MAEEEDKGYRVEDKRFIFREEQEKAKAEAEGKPAETTGGAERPEAEAQGPTGPGAARRKAPLPQMTFSVFVVSLNSSALIHLGEVPDPATGKVEPDLDLAKQTVDLLGLLKEKTRGNLTRDEEQLLDAILFDLRMRYVKLKG